MTRITCPSESFDGYYGSEERSNTPTNGELIEELDAYGHLTWVVGFNDEWAEDSRCECPKFEACEGLVPLCKSCGHPEHRGDWLACFDFKISNHVEKGLVIAYHAVVNSDSGGFIDTGESGVVPLSKAPFNLPDYWASIGMDNGTPWTMDECKAVEICNDRWNKDLISEIARAKDKLDG